MSAIQTQHLFRVDLDGCPLEVELSRPLSHTDALADEIVVAVRRGMTPLDLTGMSVLGCMTYSTRQTLPLSGRITGSSVLLPLTANCYAIPGPFTLTLQLLDGDTRHTLLRLTGTIARSSADQLISSGDLLPTLPELLEDISAMREATATALSAADEAEQAASRTDAALGSALGEAADALAEAAPAIVLTTGGTAVTLADAADRPALQLTTTLTAVQAGSGAPSPTNIRPITGWNATGVHRTQKNLLPPLTKGTSLRPSTGEETENTGGAVSGWIPWTAETAMVISGLPLTLFNFVAAYDANRGYLGRTTASSASERTLTEDGWQGADVSAARYIRVTVYENSTAVSGSIDDIDTAQMQLELGSTATEYEEYQGQTLSADLPETVYGGLLNWTTGVLTVTHVHYSLAVSEMNNAEAYPGWKGLDGLKGYMGTVSAAMGVCSAYGSPSVNTLSGAAANAIIYLHDSGMTQSEWIAAYPDLVMDVVIPISNTYDVQLTPQQLALLKGANTLRSDAGGTSVTYIADTKLYIDNAVAAIAASMLNA